MTVKKYSLQVSEEILSKRYFSMEDQIDFSKFSGDINPIHIDPIAARRTLSGQCIVHGMHSLLWALDSLAKVKGISVSKIRVRFLKPIFLDEEVYCIYNQQKKELSLSTDDLKLAAITLELESIEANNDIQTSIENPRNGPNNLTFLECSKLTNQGFKIFGDVDLSKKLFPFFSHLFGIATACEIGALSQIVGMECPGLHSMYVSLAIEIKKTSNRSFFSVEKADERVKLLTISVQGNALLGKIEAIYRPKPATNLNISEISVYVVNNEFKNIRALVIGGSRGLGEVVAKLIAAGGGEAIITYNVGRSDAEKVFRDIKSWGGKCKTYQLTVNKNSHLPLNDLNINQLYYFPSPKIFGKRTTEVDKKLIKKFEEIYVNGFEKICKLIINTHQVTSVLYPSTIAIDEPIPELSEYISAKIKGENICSVLNKNRFLRILTPRLPRLDTDQTLSILKVRSKNTVETMLPLVRGMQI